jgi:hypothetical protein
MQIGRITVTENQVYNSFADQDRNSPASCWPLVPLYRIDPATSQIAGYRTVCPGREKEVSHVHEADRHSIWMRFSLVLPW